MSKDVPAADVASVRKQMARRPNYRRLMTAEAKKDFIAIKNKMMEEFNSHKVTREIEEGSSAENISGSLPKGNLFSFIGFIQGDNPTDDIREVLRDVFVIGSIAVNSSRGTVSFSVPDKKEVLLAIWEKTPLEWAPGRSWADGIETGLSGLGQYIYSSEGFNKDSSRSMTGLQTKSRIKKIKDSGNFAKGTVFKPKKYIRAIINNAINKVESLKNKKYQGTGTIT